MATPLQRLINSAWSSPTDRTHKYDSGNELPRNWTDGWPVHPPRDLSLSPAPKAIELIFLFGFFQEQPELLSCSVSLQLLI